MCTVIQYDEYNEFHLLLAYHLNAIAIRAEPFNYKFVRCPLFN